MYLSNLFLASYLMWIYLSTKNIQVLISNTRSIEYNITTDEMILFTRDPFTHKCFQTFPSEILSSRKLNIHFLSHAVRFQLDLIKQYYSLFTTKFNYLLKAF